MSLQCLVVVMEDSARLAAGGGSPSICIKIGFRSSQWERVKGSAVPAGRWGGGGGVRIALFVLRERCMSKPSATGIQKFAK